MSLIIAKLQMYKNTIDNDDYSSLSKKEQMTEYDKEVYKNILYVLDFLNSEWIFIKKLKILKLSSYVI